MSLLAPLSPKIKTKTKFPSLQAKLAIKHLVLNNTFKQFIIKITKIISLNKTK